MQRNTKAPTASGDDQSTPDTPTSDQPEKGAKIRPSRLSLDTAGEPSAACESGLTPDLKRVSLPSFPTSGSAESGDGFTTVKRKRSKCKTPSHLTEQIIINVSPNNLAKADGTIIDLSQRQMLKEYARDEDKHIVEKKVKVFHGLEQKLIGADLLKGFDKADKPEQRRLQTPKFSIRWFKDYLHSNQELLQCQPNFVCAVSTLRILICACYEEEEVREWTIYAKKLDGIWYLSEGWPDYESRVTYDVQYAARMFEILSTETKSLRQAATLAKNFLRHEKTYQVWQAQLGNHRLLYSGDIDCVDDRGNAVELKTMTMSRWASKLRRTWAQIHFMGSKKVVVGYLECKDGAIKLDNVEEIGADRLRPDASAPWKTEICNACLDKILHSLKDDAFFQDEAMTYELTLDRNSKKITAKRSAIELPL